MEAIDGSDYLNGSDYFRCNCNCKVEVRCECLQVAEMVVPGQGGSCALAAGRAKELMHRDRAFLQLTSRDFDARCRKVDLWLVFVGRVCPEGFWCVNKFSLTEPVPSCQFVNSCGHQCSDDARQRRGTSPSV